MLRPPLILGIETDPVLAGCDLIAEAWDAAGLYQVGAFPGQRHGEWNGRFRDDLRRFLRGDDGTIEALMARLVGSPDLYHGLRARPSRSVNFVTCHDGFTLADLVSYNHKHNEANGEHNRDGSDHNLAWNCGVEGPTRSRPIRAVRRRQIRNALALLLLSNGRPMLWMGDEVGRTQQGNNNAYCQDNPLGWFRWEDVEASGELRRFLAELAALAGGLPELQADRFWEVTSHLQKGDLSWHGVVLGKPDWSAHSHSLAWTLERSQVHVMANAWWRELPFELPPLPAGQRWHRVLDTARPAPADIQRGEDAPAVTTTRYRVTSHSVVVMMARPVSAAGPAGTPGPAGR
jgi:glycogen operon protein